MSAGSVAAPGLSCRRESPRCCWLPPGPAARRGNRQWIIIPAVQKLPIGFQCSEADFWMGKTTLELSSPGARSTRWEGGKGRLGMPTAAHATHGKKSGKVNDRGLAALCCPLLPAAAVLCCPLPVPAVPAARCCPLLSPAHHCCPLLSVLSPARCCQVLPVAVVPCCPLPVSPVPRHCPLPVASSVSRGLAAASQRFPSSQECLQGTRVPEARGCL